MICGLCDGAQNLMCVHEGRCEWYECPGCGGAGVRMLYSQPSYRMHKMRQKKPRKVEADGCKSRLTF